MYFNEFTGVRIAALAVALPDDKEEIISYANRYPEGEIEKFCQSTGMRERYVSANLKTTASDLCVAAAQEIFRRMDIDKGTIDALIFLTQTPDYVCPPTSHVIQYRLGLEDCGLVYDSNFGCTGGLVGIQMACADLLAGCRRVLMLAGNSEVSSPDNGKDDLLLSDCGIAMVLERTENEDDRIRVGLHTIGKGCQAIMVPYGMKRHPLRPFYEARGIDGVLDRMGRRTMQGTDVFTFSIKDAPKMAKEFLAHFNCTIDDYDLISIHQANKMIVDNVAKRIKAPAEKVLRSLERYCNTRGSSVLMNLCDYAQQKDVHQGTKRVFNLAFGSGLSVAAVDMELDLSVVLPIIKTAEAFDDGIDSFTFFTEEENT